MKLTEILEESLIDKIKAALGTVKGKIVSSVSSLLTAFKKNPSAILTTIEKFKIVETSHEYLSRVDTGALVCALHAEEIKVDEEAKKVSFKLDGKTYDMKLLRVKDVKNANGTASRPRVELSYVWNGKTYHGIETSLTDRSKMKFKCLVGRNLIKELKLPVHISDDETHE